MSDIPNWLRSLPQPQLSRHDWRDGNPYWCLDVWSFGGSKYELRIFPNNQTYLDGSVGDEYRFYTAEDDGVSDWKEVVTFQQMREDEAHLSAMACSHPWLGEGDPSCGGGEPGKTCPDVEAAVTKYVETHHMVHSDSAIFEIKQHLIRVWLAITLLASVGP